MKGWMIALVVLVGLVVVGGSFVVYGICLYNGAVRTENGLVAQYEQNKNNRSTYALKITEMFQVPDKYKSDLKEIIDAQMQGRYGKDGSQAAFQWLKEHNISFDSSLYAKVQDQITIGRDKFENEQKKLIDRKRVYEDTLGTFPRNLFLGALGFPTDKIKDIKIIVSSDTQQMFDSGIDEGLKLN